jgi:hypothetical protein
MNKIKMTKKITFIGGAVLLVLLAGGLYFFSNYELVKNEASEDAAAENKSILSGSVLDVKVVAKAKDLSPQEAGEKAIKFANENLLSEGSSATLVSVKEENGLYTFKLMVDDQEYESYVTKNGKMLFIQGVKMEETAESNPEATEPVQVEKKDKPEVKVFVMSYCPFGLLAEKMFLPVYDLLKDKADMGIYFVNYAMHGKPEVDENLRQYCIQKDQKDKYSAYLSCFVADTSYNDCKTGDCTANFSKCLTEANIDEAKLGQCVAESDAQFKVTANYNDKASWLSGQFPKFDVHTDLNTKYGVEGSPTFVINDAKVELSPRTAEQFKKTICAAFNNEPAECATELSGETPSSGFGTGSSSGSSGGDCGG